MRAVQLIDERVSAKDGSFRSYEMNLVFNNCSRINIVDHGSLSAIRQDSRMLSEFLRVPIWDVIGFRVSSKTGERDQKIDIRVWRPSLRIPPITGPQGHYPIPVKGDRVRVHIKMEGEKKYSALLPNGFSIIN